MKVFGNDPLHKVTIIPRGRALGLAFTLPEDDRVSVTRQQIEAKLVMLYGGRVAEELVFGRERVTTGAQSDIQRATGIARSYVTNWGLSDVIGPILVGENETEVFLGRDLGTRRGMSESTAQTVDAEVSRIVSEAYERARVVPRTAHLRAARAGRRAAGARDLSPRSWRCSRRKELPPCPLTPPVPTPPENPRAIPAAPRSARPSGSVELKPRSRTVRQRLVSRRTHAAGGDASPPASRVSFACAVCKWRNYRRTVVRHIAVRGVSARFPPFPTHAHHALRTFALAT